MDSSYSRNDKIIRRKFYQYLIPTVLMVLAMQFGSLADAIVIGNFLGDSALSAASLALPVIFLVEIPGMMTGTGASIVGANYIGKRLIKEASQTFYLSMFLSFVSSLIFFPVAIFAGNQIAGLFAGSFGELTPMISQYIQVYAYQAPILGIGITLAYWLSSDNHPNLGAAFFIITNIVHVGAEILFCVFLSPDVAMWGVAGSMGIGMLAGMTVLIPYIRSKKRVVDLKTPFKGAFSLAKPLLKSGSSAGALTLLSFVYYLVLNIAATSYLQGMEMPLYAMLTNFSFVIDIFVIGILQIMPSVVSSLFGEKDYFGIRAICKRVFLIAMGTTVVLTAVSMIFPELFFAMFGVNLSSIRDGLTIDPLFVVRIYCLSFLFYTVNKYIVYYYPSVMLNGPSLLSNVLRMGAVGPVSIFFLMMGFGVMGFSYGVILMEGAGALLVFLFIFIMKKLGRYPGKGVLLLPASEKKENQVDLSIPAKEEEISAVVEALQNAAFEISKDETAAAMLALAAEEIIANTIAYGYRHHGPSQYIDVNLAKTEQGILVRIRDDGIAFDPTTYQPGDEEDMRFQGIEIIRKVAKDFKYLRLLNTNNTIIEIPMGEKIA